MPLTAEQSYALGTREGRDRINQQLRADPQYQRFLQSIGVNTGGPIHLSDQQRKQAADWVRTRFGSIGGLEIDPSGNLNNPQGFGTQLEQWGPVAAGAGVVAAPFVLPALGIGGGGTLASSSVPTSLSMQAVPASIASQGVSAGVGGATAGGLGTAGTVGTAAAGSGVGSKLASGGMDALKDLASPQGAAGLAALIAGLVGNRDSQQNTDEMRRIQGITEAQMRRADPLHQVATNLAFGRLPVNYRQGVQMNNIPLPE